LTFALSPTPLIEQISATYGRIGDLVLDVRQQAFEKQGFSDQEQFLRRD
jgi:hypothetical protein